MDAQITGAAVNRLLNSLPAAEYERLAPELKPVALSFGQVLYEIGDAIKHVYFPNDSIISLLSAMSDRSTLEVGMVGNEGMAGISVFMGVDVSLTRAIVQGAGSAISMTSTTIRREANRLGPFHQLLHRYSHSLHSQISQSSACNRFHSVDARLARWLMMTSDRLGNDEFRLTQDFMSKMLGVRREGVNRAASHLQAAHMIRYSRGMIAILDRVRLEARACECYAIMKNESDQYLN
ncbi:MAG TPA: Crp/Fnr family transcriptional regulator [Pyrinomonadaceae bacterium]